MGERLLSVTYRQHKREHREKEYCLFCILDRKMDQRWSAQSAPPPAATTGTQAAPATSAAAAEAAAPAAPGQRGDGNASSSLKSSGGRGAQFTLRAYDFESHRPEPSA